MSEEQKQSPNSPEASSPEEVKPAAGGDGGNATASTTQMPPQAAVPQGGSSRGNVAGASAPSVGAPQKRSVGLRRIRMTISKVDIMSAVKLGFLLSVVFAFMVVIAMAIIWFVLDGIHVFSQLQGLLETLNSAALLEFMQYLEFGRWMSFAVIIAILDVVLLTALSAVGALVYNLISSLVGGLRISVTDE